MIYKEVKVIYSKKKVPQLGKQQGGGRWEGGGQTTRSLDYREMTIEVARFDVFTAAKVQVEFF
jgi:hypothetical protein